MGHLLAEEHQPALRVTCSAPNPGLGYANAPFHHLAPLAVVFPSQNSHATSAIEIALKTIPGKLTTHLLLNDLAECQARRMQGLDVLDITILLGAQFRTLGVLGAPPARWKGSNLGIRKATRANSLRMYGMATA
jgi:hypothetical protein